MGLKSIAVFQDVRYRRQLAIHFYEKETSMPYALCPMPYALCPMPMSTSRNLRKAIQFVSIIYLKWL
ncbi:MAG: hypothetical protein WBL95_23250 [Microcoleus sp.]